MAYDLMVSAPPVPVDLGVGDSRTQVRGKGYAAARSLRHDRRRLAPL